MIDSFTGVSYNPNVPFGERDFFLRETGYMNPQVTTGWERDLAEGYINNLEHEPDLEQ